MADRMDRMEPSTVWTVWCMLHWESQREPNAKPSLFADLKPSEPDDRQVDRPTLLMFNTLKTL